MFCKLKKFYMPESSFVDNLSEGVILYTTSIINLLFCIESISF